MGAQIHANAKYCVSYCYCPSDLAPVALKERRMRDLAIARSGQTIVLAILSSTHSFILYVSTVTAKIY